MVSWITKEEVVHQLRMKIITRENRCETGKWAYAMYLERIKDADNQFYDLLVDLAAMEYGAEFELSYDDLDEIADSFIANDAMYAKIKFCRDLKRKIEQREEIEDIGRWVYTFYYDRQLNDDKKFHAVIYDLMFVEEGPEFAHSYEKLHEIVDTLIASENVKFMQS